MPRNTTVQLRAININQWFSLWHEIYTFVNLMKSHSRSLFQIESFAWGWGEDYQRKEEKTKKRRRRGTREAFSNFSPSPCFSTLSSAEGILTEFLSVVGELGKTPKSDRRLNKLEFLECSVS